MIRGKKLLLVLVSCLWIIGSTACTPTRPTKDEIVGLWVERRETSKVKDTEPCAYFEFSDNGTFEARYMPREYFNLGRSLPLEYLTRIDATGTWTLDTSSTDPFALHRINLEFAPVPGFPLGFSGHLSITYPPSRDLRAGVPDDPWVIFSKKAEVKCK